MQAEQTQEIPVSVVIPVYNVADALRDTLDSVTGQTMRQIEIICVDDASTDGSGEILAEYAACDPRIRLILHETNLSTSQGRKDGAAASVGKYVMFVDGDDTLVPQACEKAYAAIEAAGTDMLQFGAQVLNCAGMPQERIDRNQRMLEPYTGRIEGESLIDACWKDHRFGFNLWNKIYSGPLCRRAMAQIEDGQFPKAQDLYAFFMIAYHADSYAGIRDRLYEYHFGLGVTGRNRMSLRRFGTLLTEKRVTDALRRFAQRQADGAALLPVIGQIEDHFRAECISSWVSYLDPEDKEAGFDLLADAWGRGQVLQELAARARGQNEGGPLKKENNELRRCLRSLGGARIDLKHTGGPENDLEILEVTGTPVSESTPAWFSDEEGTGHVLQSDGQTPYGGISMRVRCMGSGTFRLTLRGNDARDANGSRLQIRMDYTSLLVCEERILKEPKTVSHDYPYRYERRAADGEELTVSVSWKSHALAQDEDEIRQLREPEKDVRGGSTFGRLKRKGRS